MFGKTILPRGQRVRNRIRLQFLQFRRALARIGARQRDDHVIYLAASLAYFSLLALVPISALSLSLFASFVSNDKDQEKIFNWVVGYVFPFDEDLRVDWNGALKGAIEGEEDFGEISPEATMSPDRIAPATAAQTYRMPASGTPEAGGEAIRERFPGEKTQRETTASNLDAIQEKFEGYVDEFVSQARGLKEIGLIFLIVAGFWLFDSIEDAFNKIWRSEKRRTFVRRFIIFWTVLTLAPLLMVGPVILNRFVESRHIPLNIEVFWGLLPYFLTWFAIWLMYMLIPNGIVDKKAAAASAFVVAILWELAKRAFAEYVANAESYQTVYGSLSIVLLVLAWFYYTWWLILEGLEVCAYLQYPDWDRMSRYGDLAPEIGLLYSWGGLFYAGQTFVQGKGGTATESISSALGLDQVRVLRILSDLERIGMLVRDQKGQWFPAIPLDQITWADVAAKLDYDIDSSTVSLSEWLESALRARGVVEYRQDTKRLPTLETLLKQHLDSAVLEDPGDRPPFGKPVSTDPMLPCEDRPSEADQQYPNR